MNSQLQNAIDIKSRVRENNPFVLTMHANSTSHEQVQLCICAHVLKKLSIIDISQSRQLAELFKQCLQYVVENSLIDLNSQQTVRQIVQFLENWQISLGKIASWPHTRTCFYYLEQKLKKNKYFQNLDYVRLKRAQLQPNKKQFLTQIIAEPIHSQFLQDYITQLKQNLQSASQKSFSFSNSLPVKSQSFIKSQKIIPEIVQPGPKIIVNTNILYSDSFQDWKQIQKIIHQMHEVLKNHKAEEAQQIKEQINTLIDTYLLEKLPVFINWMKIKNYSKDKILEELTLRRSVIIKFGVKQHSQIMNLTISKIIHNHPL